MRNLTVAQAIENRKANARGRKYPAHDDERIEDGIVLPVLRPSFAIRPDDRIFTVGSCFARNIEQRLEGYDVPTRRFDLPKGEVAGRAVSVLNEYNAGTMAQRITYAAQGRTFDDRAVIAEGDGYGDLLLAGGKPVAFERLMERRAQVDELYALLPRSQVLIVTLGLVEAWYDLESELYINRAPGPAAFRDPEQSKRYELRILDVDDVVSLLQPALEAALGAGLGKIVLTVSPVPLQTTFDDRDVLVANGYSKAVLRAAADKLAERIDALDYFPSYEMVTVTANNPYDDDNVHVRNDVVARVIRHMLEHYLDTGEIASAA